MKMQEENNSWIKDLAIGIVGSLIATVIVAFVTWIFNDVYGKENVWEAIHMSLYISIPLVAFVWGCYAIIRLYAHRSKNKKLRQLLDETEFITPGHTKWSWSWKEEDGKYSIVELSPHCPECGYKLNCGLYRKPAYQCINGHGFDVHNWSDTKAHITNLMRKRHPEFAGIIN